jgi:hypothetical protein
VFDIAIQRGLLNQVILGIQMVHQMILQELQIPKEMF